MAKSSGKRPNLRVNRSLTSRWSQSAQTRARRKLRRLRGLPSSRLKRFFWRLDPRHFKEYWWNREGAVVALKALGIAILAVFVLTLGIFAYFRKDLPKLSDISAGNLGGSISYYDRTGKVLLWSDYNAVKRVPVQSQNISPYLKQATIAVEDRNFYKEKGFSIQGTIRAALNDVFHRGNLQGGSTIDEQLIKLTQDFNQNRTIALKIKELILAVELERTYTKDQILTGYLNAAPYGGVDYGVQTASSDYFHKDAKDLTLGESAFLAAIPQSPAYYSPYDTETFDSKALAGRMQYILQLMVNQHMITKAQQTVALGENVLAEIQPQQTKYAGIQAPYFVLAAKNQLDSQIASQTSKLGGLKIITTLDVNLEGQAEKLVASNLPAVQRLTAGLADEEATVTEDVQTGQIMDLVGGVNFNDPTSGQINYADSVLVPPGSSFKPYDYTTLIDNNNNVGAGSVLYDTESPLPGYPCTNHATPRNGGNCLQDYDFLQPGPITLRYALGGSRNIPAVKSMLEAVPGDTSSGRTTSINKVISTASALMDNTYLQSQGLKAYNCYTPGIDITNVTASDVTQCYGASAIGDGAFLHLDDHVNGLASLARLGAAIPRTFILSITNSDGKKVYQWKQPKATQAVKQDSAYIVDNMASDPSASYLPGSCTDTTCTTLAHGGYKFQRYNGWHIAVKTGTTDNGFDGLMTSWDTKYSTVSWVGNHTRNVDISSRTGIAMEYLTEPLTRGMTEYALNGLSPVNWSQPSDIKSEPAFVVRNHIHYGDVEPSPSTDIFPAWYVGKSSTSGTNQTIDKVSNNVATSCTPALARQTVNNGNTAAWNIDIFNGGSTNTGVTGTNSGASQTNDTLHVCGEAQPTITLTVNDSLPASVPNTSCTVSCTFVATASAGAHPLYDPQYASAGGGYINFLVDNQIVKTINFTDTDSTTQTYSYTVTSSGSMTVSAQVVDSVLYEGDSNPVTVSGKATLTGFAPGGHTISLASFYNTSRKSATHHSGR